MLSRSYGKTGQELSIIGMGGIVVMGMQQSDADRITREAFDRGINYFDVAPSYGDAEERLGPALKGFRDNVFLACKTEKRSKSEASQALRDSLKRLGTDHLDLYQLHAVTTPEDVDAILSPGGVLEAFAEARDAGLIRFLGFSAHSPDAAITLMDAYPFDSVLFPFNYTTFLQAGFGPQVLDKAREKGVARLALKAMARRPWPDGSQHKQPNCWYEPFTDPHEAELALRWTLSLDITAALPPGDPEIFRMAMDIAERFQPLSQQEQQMVLERKEAETPIFAAV